jgi:hypothetical protein
MIWERRVLDLRYAGKSVASGLTLFAARSFKEVDMLNVGTHMITDAEAAPWSFTAAFGESYHCPQKGVT